MMTRSSVIYTSLENYEETVLGPEKTLKMVAIDPGNYVMGGDKNDELGTKKIKAQNIGFMWKRFG